MNARSFTSHCSFVLILPILFLASAHAANAAQSAGGVNITAPTVNQTLNSTNTFTFTCSPIVEGSGSPNQVTLISQYCDSYACDGTVKNITVNNSGGGETIAFRTGGDGNPKTRQIHIIGDQTNTAEAFNDGSVFLRCKIVDLDSGSCTGDGCVSINTWNVSVQDVVAPTVVLHAPANNSWSNTTGAINFTFIPNDVSSGISACNLVINGNANQSNTTVITENSKNNISTPLPAGTHTWTVNCTDTSALKNNRTNSTFNINIDVAAPNITIHHPANNSVSTTRNLTFNFTVVENLGSSIHCTLAINGSLNQTNSSVTNNTHTYMTVSNFNHGDYVYNLSCFDNANNINISSRLFTINISPTLGSIAAGPSPIKGGSVLSVNASLVDDPNNDTLNFYCDTTNTPTAANTDCTGGITADTTNPYTLTCTFATPETDADNTVFCRTFDGTSYSPSVNTTYTTDTTPPTTTIASVAGDLNVTYYDKVDDSITIINISGESGMLCRIGTSDVVYSSLSDECAVTETQANCSAVTTDQGANAYNFHISCKDSLGNEQSKQQNNDITSFVTDWTAPTTTDNAVSDTQPAPYTVTLTEIDNIDGDPDTLFCTDAVGACTPSITIDNAGIVTFTSANRGNNYLRYHSTDDAGNQQATTNVTIVINLLANFTNATDGLANVKGGGNVTIHTNATDADAQTLKLYVCKNNSANGSDGCFGTNQEYCSNTTALSNATCSFSAETDSATHTWYAFLFDALNESAFENHTGTYVTDSTPPNITVVHPANTTHTQNSLATSVSLSEPALWVGYSLDGASNVTMLRVSDTSWSATISDLSDGGHSVVFYANDSVNNTGVASRLFNVDVSSGDTQPPSLIVVNPVNNTLFNKTVMAILLNITVDENATWAAYSLDDAANVSLGNVSLRNWNATLTNLADGTHTVRFFANDSVQNTGVSDLIQFTTDIHSPFQLDFNITPRLVNDTVSVTIYSQWNDTLGLSHALIEHNSTGTRVNHTIAMSGTSDWGNLTLNASSLNPGDIRVVVYANDTSGNFNTTSALTISVADVTPPLFNISHTPTTPDDIDPNVLINITANVSDYSNSSFVILQFKELTAANWNNFTMTRTGDTTYVGNFTPSTSNNWTFRVWANDSRGNTNISATTTLPVILDTTWRIIGFPANETSALLGTNKTIGTFRLNNTGDYDLEFSLSYTPATIDVTFNQSTSFNLSSGSLTDISVNVTALSTQSTTALSIKAASQNTSATPTFTYANLTFISTADGPFLFVAIDKPLAGTSVPVGTDAFNLTATVKNLGTQDSTGTWLLWALPDDWINNSALNRSIGFLGVGEKAIHTITANLPGTASTGTATLSAQAGNLQNINGSTTRTVTLTAAITASSSSAESTTTLPSAGGGSGGARGSGGVSLSKITRGVEILNTSQTYELVRGQGSTFPVEITNVFAEATLYNVTLLLDGFLQQYVSIWPTIIREIPPGSTHTFDVTITSPAYLSQDEHELVFTITGNIIGVKVEDLDDNTRVTSYLRKNLIEQRTVRLLLHEISPDEATLHVQHAQEHVQWMTRNALPSEKVNTLLEQVQSAFATKQYRTVQELSNRIAALRSQALAAHIAINDVQQRIAQAERDGLSVVETKKLIHLSLAAFEREDFATAEARATEAQLSFVIETKGQLNYLLFVKKHWALLSSSLVLLFLAGYLLRQKLSLIIISRRLDDLNKEAVTITQLMTDAQEQTFKNNAMSSTEYHKHMYHYEHRLSEIHAMQMKLRSKKVGIIRIADELQHLNRENHRLVDALKTLQEAYYTAGAMSKNKYVRKSEEYKLRLAEIEKAIALMEYKLAKKEHRELHPSTKKQAARQSHIPHPAAPAADHGKKSGLRSSLPANHHAKTRNRGP